MEALIGKLLEYGTTPALLVLAALVALLIRKLDENAKKDTERATAFQKSLSDHVAATELRFTEQAERMACIERDYLPRETHYKDIGGWRTDMNEMRKDFGEELGGVRHEMTVLNTNLISTVLKGVANGGS